MPTPDKGDEKMEFAAGYDSNGETRIEEPKIAGV